MTRCKLHTKKEKDNNYTKANNQCEIHHGIENECYPCHLQKEHIKVYPSEEEYLKDIEKPKMIAKTKEEREAEKLSKDKEKKDEKKK